jgi:ubiquinol-cytochrome c reductase cytochrome c subunit
VRAAAAVLAGLAVLAAAAGAAAAAPTDSLVRQGKGLFGEYCVACHGANGEGIRHSDDTRIGGGAQRVQEQQAGYGPSLHGVGALAADFYLRTGYMPLRKVGIQPRRTRVLFSERQLRALIAYVASLGGGPEIPKPQPARGSLAAGLHLFTDRCAGCHQVVAQGGFVTGAVPPPLEDATPTQIAEAVRIGPYVMPAFSKKALSDRQLDSIIAYVQYTKHPNDSGGWAIGTIGPVPEGLVAWFFGGVLLVALCMIIGKRLHAPARERDA